MINTDSELNIALSRIDKVRRRVAQLRESERDPDRYHSSAAGFLEQIGRIQNEARHYLRRVSNSPSAKAG